MSSIRLPNEIFFMIVQHLPTQRSILALMRTDRRMYHLLREYLYDRTTGNEKNKALNWAAKRGLEDLVRAMLRRGGDIRMDKDTFWHTKNSEPRPRRWLSMAISDAAENGHASIVSLLLERQPSALNMRSGYDDWPLRKAAARGHAETVKILLNHSANIPHDEINDSGFGAPTSFNFSPALNEAFRHGQEEIVNAMLADGRVSMDRESLAAAAWGGHERLVDLCLREAPPWSPERQFLSPLGAAAQRGNAAAFKMILTSNRVDPNMRDDSLRTPLFVAAEFGQEEIVKILIETDGVHPDTKNKYGETALSSAAANGSLATVECLLATGAVDVDNKDHRGSTPLFAAASIGNEKIARRLIAAGANPEHRNSDGQSPLWHAAGLGAANVVKVLLATGRVDPDAKDRSGMTPLARAARSGRFLGKPTNFVYTKEYEKQAEKVIVPLLQGAEPNASSANNQPPAVGITQDPTTRDGLSVMKQLLSLREVDPDSQDKSGRTPLSHAVQMHEVDAVRVLLDTKRVDVNCADSDGWTPLTWIEKKEKNLNRGDWEAACGW
ncbi:uncharacterized protein N7482_010638 [Penicillium canariense]|uniref:F-box domain-containing protein n=1 Tax=Penicillium canariense TaxID=189055 RepID=A0A9W9LD49_9EURO|nr:uncharacterized protein N7482_010638 [Penicillium canariense]KAJ5151386.1 hypothetical protein N7482_010638 [Penicillium canariense]